MNHCCAGIYLKGVWFLIQPKFLDVVANDQGDDREGFCIIVERWFEIPFSSKIGVEHNLPSFRIDENYQFWHS